MLCDVSRAIPNFMKEEGLGRMLNFVPLPRICNAELMALKECTDRILFEQ